MGSGSSSSKSDGPDISPINVTDTVKGYRPARPPKWKKRDVFRIEDYRDIDNRASKVTINNETTFTSLASDLTTGLNSDLKKVRALFTWTGKQDPEGQFYPGVTDGRTPRGALKLIKQGDGTYADLFAMLCRAAGLQCVKVRGNCKSMSYDVGDQNVDRLKTTWNAVCLDGDWQIVHPMWAFTAVVGHDSGRWTKIETEGQGSRQKASARAGISVRHIDEEFFLPHPQEFLYQCIAEKKEWQLVSEPWDLHKFCNVPQIEFYYFTSDFKLKSPHEAIVPSENGKCELLFHKKSSTDMKFQYELFFDEEQSEESLPSGVELPRCVFYETAGNDLRLVVRFHVAGIYKLSINYIQHGMKAPIASFRLDAKERSKNENMLPVNPDIGYGFGHTAREHGITKADHRSGVVVTKTNIEVFKFIMTQTTNLIARLRHNRINSDELDQYVTQEVKGNEVTVNVKMPEGQDGGEYALQIYSETENNENNVLNYLLTSKKDDFEKIQEDVLRKNLAVALGQHKVEPLEAAITEFEQAKLKDVFGDLNRAKKKLKKLKEDEKRMGEVTTLKRRLQKAMQHHDSVELERAINEVETAGYTELEGLLDRARVVLAQWDTEVMDKETASELRTNLKNATRNRRRPELETAIRMFQKANLPDEGDLTKAQTELCHLYEEAAELQMAGGEIEALETLLKETEVSVVKERLKGSDVIRRAQKFLTQQKRLKGFLSDILALSHATVAEIQGYGSPKDVTEDVIKATLLVLGEKPAKLGDWKEIRKQLKPSGDILKRIKLFKLERLHTVNAERAVKLLDKYTTDDVREISAGVATFFKWSKNILQERQREKSH